MFQTKVAEKIDPHIVCPNPPQGNHAVYEIMWKNVVEWGSLQMTIWSKRITCWIPKATNTHSRMWNTSCFSTATMFAWTRLIVTLYEHYLYCIFTVWRRLLFVCCPCMRFRENRLNDSRVVLQCVKEEGRLLHRVKLKKTNGIGLILFRKCLLQQLIKGPIEGTGIRWRRWKKLVFDLKETRI